MDYIGFIPCRAGSERVKNKNTRPFADYAGGLIELKLSQMSNVLELAEIVVSSNDSQILDYAAQFSAKTDSRVLPLERPDEYGRGSTSMERFIVEYISKMRDTGTIVWTHVTHPFASSMLYRQAIQEYEKALQDGYDSLISATRRQTFLWRDGKPFNYDNSTEKWPRSQDIPPVYEINHAIYVMPFETMRAAGDRIGAKPYFFEMTEKDAMDIDWEDQFHLLEQIFELRKSRGDILT